jgi:hypothetical protein
MPVEAIRRAIAHTPDVAILELARSVSDTRRFRLAFGLFRRLFLFRRQKRFFLVFAVTFLFPTHLAHSY